MVLQFVLLPSCALSPRLWRISQTAAVATSAINAFEVAHICWVRG